MLALIKDQGSIDPEHIWYVALCLEYAVADPGFPIGGAWTL